jgi:hypothetical protein
MPKAITSKLLKTVTANIPDTRPHTLTLFYHTPKIKPILLLHQYRPQFVVSRQRCGEWLSREGDNLGNGWVGETLCDYFGADEAGAAGNDDFHCDVGVKGLVVSGGR